MSDKTSDQLITERAAADIVGLSVDSLRRDRKDGRLGRIPFLKFGTGLRGTIRYARDDLDRFLSQARRVA
jgi:hypothetical protein